jgi:hypothetical protein
MRLFPVFLFCAVTSVHAASGLSVQTLSFEGKNQRGEPIAAGEVTMPFIQADDPAVAANINDRLYIDLAGTLAPRKPGKHLAVTETIGMGTASQSFTILRQDERILSIGFEAEGCGAYCENYHSYYSFEAATGRLLVFSDLFTRDGMRQLRARMIKERLRLYRLQAAEHQKALDKLVKQKGPKTEEAIKDLEDRIDLNNDCAARVRAPEEMAYSVPTLFGYYSYQIHEKKIVLIASRCSNHAMRALDEVAEVSLSFPYESLGPYLTAYGKSLLLGEGSARPDSFYGQILRGRVGGSPVVMMLNNASGNTVSGTYFYEKYNKQIGLSGQVKGNSLTLAEGNESSPKAAIHLTVSGKQLKGYWKGNKQLDIELTVP